MDNYVKHNKYFVTYHPVENRTFISVKNENKTARGVVNHIGFRKLQKKRLCRNMVSKLIKELEQNNG